MVVRTFIKSKRSTHGLNSGFTLVELTATLLISSILIGLALQVIVDQRRIFIADQARIQVNQNLRAAMDLVGTDIRQTGERLERDSELPGISVINGASGAPDELVLQRKLLPDVMPVCQTITAGSTQPTIDVSVVTPSPATIALPLIGNCLFSNGNISDNPDVPDTLEQFRNYRRSQNDSPGTNPPVATRTTILNSPATNCSQVGGADGECAWAYIHDPVNNRGEFFLYSFENTGSCAFGGALLNRTCFRIHASPRPTGTWQYTYTYGGTAAAAANQPRIYILEERRYSLLRDPGTPPPDNDDEDCIKEPGETNDDCILQLVLNRQTTAPLRLVNQLSSFQIQAQTPAGMVDSFNPLVNSLPTWATDWRQVRSLRVNLTATNPNPNIPVSNLGLSSQFLPRNTLSN